MDFIAFQTLYVILNEDDSQEYYLDTDGRLFKLDNASSFNLNEYHVAMSFNMSEDAAIARLKNSLHLTEYDKYAIILRILSEKYGDVGRRACLSMFERFSVLDETIFDEALDSLSEIYPSIISEYFYIFIIYRKALCTQFLKSNLIER